MAVHCGGWWWLIVAESGGSVLGSLLFNILLNDLFMFMEKTMQMIQ